MTKKNVIIVSILLFISTILLSLSFLYTQKQQEKNIRGSYTFANTKKNIPLMKTIKIKSNKDELTIYSQNNIWKIKEAADYYVNPEILVNFYDMINNSIITTILDKTQKNEFKEGISIEIYDEDDKLLDTVILEETPKNKENRHALINNNSVTYLINKTEKFSSELSDWVPYPLLRLPYKNLSSIEINGIRIKKDLLEKILPYYEEIENSLKFLSYLSYEAIIKKEDILKIIPNTQPHNITVTLFDGTIYSFDIYKNGNMYLITITLDITKIHKKGTAEFVKINQPYYSDWFFAISEEDGELLYNLNLSD